MQPDHQARGPSNDADWGSKPARTRSVNRPTGKEVDIGLVGAIRESLDVGGAAKAIRTSLEGTRRSQDTKDNVSKEASMAQRMSVEIARISFDVAKRFAIRPIPDRYVL